VTKHCRCYRHSIQDVYGIQNVDGPVFADCDVIERAARRSTMEGRAETLWISYE